MEAEASGILSSYLGQLGLFGLGLIVIGLFVWLWLRESRAVRSDTETVIARKDRDIAARDARITQLEKDLAESRAKERQTYADLMECRYPKDGVG